MKYQSITYSRIIQPRQFESKKLEITIELDDNEQTEEKLKKIIRELKKKVEDEIQDK